MNGLRWDRRGRVDSCRAGRLLLIPGGRAPPGDLCRFNNGYPAAVCLFRTAREGWGRMGN